MDTPSDPNQLQVLDAPSPILVGRLRLARRVTDWMDTHWDESTGLIWYPDRRRGYSTAVPGPIHIVRESIWYAVGLLQRREPGDIDRACRIIRAVGDHQFIAPGLDYHGTFCRYPRELAIPPSPREWIDYDPNWREFIGLTLILILEDFAPLLPPALCARLESMVEAAATGSAARGVPAIYTNVALMSAVLLEAAGRRNNRTDLISQGETLAQEVFERFNATACLDEFNSPTYCGVSLGAVGHYRRPGVSPILRNAGAAIEASIWRDIAHFYHPGLRNVCGPYDRAYGMDMNQCVALAGIWIGLAVDPDDPPLPQTDQWLENRFEQSHDLCFAPYLAALGVNCPPEFMAMLTASAKGRSVRQNVSPSPLRVATAWMDQRLMIGGQDASGSRPGDWQNHPATIHWGLPLIGAPEPKVQASGANQNSGVRTCDPADIGWARFRSSHAIDAVATPHRLTLIVRRLAHIADPIHLLIQIAPPPAADSAHLDQNVNAGSWRLPGLVATITSNAGGWSVEPPTGLIHIRYDDPSDPDLLQLVFTFHSV